MLAGLERGLFSPRAAAAYSRDDPAGASLRQPDDSK